MAGFTRVQATGSVHTTAASVALTFPGTPGVGSGVVVLVSAYLPSNLLFPGTCTDNRGNTYSAVGYVGGSRGAVIYACPKIVTSGSPFTITLSAGGLNVADYHASAVEIGGVGSGGLLLDQMVTNYIVGSPASLVTPALTNNDVLLAAAMVNGAPQATITVGTATPVWLEEHEYLGSPSAEGDTRILTAGLGVAATVQWTFPSFAETWGVLAAFTGAGPAAPAAVATAQGYVWGPI